VDEERHRYQKRLRGYWIAERSPSRIGPALFEGPTELRSITDGDSVALLCKGLFLQNPADDMSPSHCDGPGRGTLVRIQKRFERAGIVFIAADELGRPVVGSTSSRKQGQTTTVPLFIRCYGFFLEAGGTEPGLLAVGSTEPRARSWASRPKDEQSSVARLRLLHVKGR